MKYHDVKFLKKKNNVKSLAPPSSPFKPNLIAIWAINARYEIVLNSATSSVHFHINSFCL